MLGFFAAWLGLLSLTAALPAVEKRGDGYNPPRQVMYIQTFHYTNGGKLSLLPLVQQKTGVTHILLSALHVNDQPGDINLNDDNPNSTVWDQVWSEAAQLQNQGVKVMMMLGGAAPGSYPRLCSGSNGAINEAYYTPLRDTLKYHKVDGLDLDIEENVDGSCPLALLRRLNSDFGNSFILTMAPVASELGPQEYGLGGFSYRDLDAAATAPLKPDGKLVNWYNAQFYNGWGDASTPIGYNAIITNGYSPSRVVLGVLDNPNDGGSGWYKVGTYKNTISTLKANYKNFGGDVGWEYWDAGGNDGYSNPWKWVKDIGSAIFAQSNAGLNLLDAPIPDAPTPWPDLIATLTGLGAGHLPAVKALNVSNGNLQDAIKFLGLSDLLPLDNLLPSKE